MDSLSLAAVSDWRPHAPLQHLSFDWLAGIELAVLRLDLIDPLISGNKWFKLAPHLRIAAQQGVSGIISLGGAHSNHLHALAAAGQRFSFATVGLLRGQPQRTPTVVDLQRFGMQLHWLGYGGYRERHRVDFWAPWHERYPGFCAVPEGGGGLPGAQGCADLLALVAEQLPALGWADYHGWWLAAGTGTTLAGLVIGEDGQRIVHGAMAVPLDHGVPEQVQALLAQAGLADAGYRLFGACRGGFARQDAELLDFMTQCEIQSGVPLEPLYTAKALMALREAIAGGVIKAGTRLIFVHTGGLQGRRAAGC
ncbi:1-aminocyclopropane-1-carboxylate deaminase [Pseudomonas daroniae]|uniref:1-aminocyclopropane-1-carboxylate deaminase n=1 Tax=Phytopseudomonas daroniae TaxID=2487519 RepID=A0A4Q9QQQ7_9GAMM|nr:MULTISPECIES: 1-aminocyclopropane-1-carboxylate deaminase [Pseudomonas]TBU82102.1 1-aminocyclopropane-1-carboxylate deaminase [Pseudomonas daroniae]TBU84562.1 1-aminocyclopropane-1-carboxylate deaminase [Pseudomonas sp. FRB 228]TBU92403.1 1-aminocyclopropane-1-carboxylate deaminase [Pseudomonas daroniae]